MAYFPDFSAYEYYTQEIDPLIVNIGWLDANHEFSKGPVCDKFLAHLWSYCSKPVQQSKGFHLCELCNTPHYPQVAQRDGRQLRLGSAEIRVQGQNGIIYAVPDFIYHYVVEHNYQPPNEFIEAVLSAPLPTSPEYIEFLNQHEVNFVFRNDEGEVIAAGGAYAFMFNNWC